MLSFGLLYILQLFQANSKLFFILLLPTQTFLKETCLTNSLGIVQEEIILWVKLSRKLSKSNFVETLSCLNLTIITWWFSHPEFSFKMGQILSQIKNMKAKWYPLTYLGIQSIKVSVNNWQILKPFRLINLILQVNHFKRKISSHWIFYLTHYKPQKIRPKFLKLGRFKILFENQSKEEPLHWEAKVKSALI